MTKIEELARAICDAMGDDPDAPRALAWRNWESYVPAARAAIEAMRVPNEAMCNAGEEQLGSYGPEVPSSSAGDMGRGFSAMIDAALAEKPK